MTLSSLQDDKEHGQYITQLTSAAEEKLGDMFFILVDPVSSPQALSFFGLQAEDCPAYVIQDQEAKYLDKNAKSDALSQFLKDFEVGALPPDLRVLGFIGFTLLASTYVIQDQEARYLAKNAKPDALSQFLRDFDLGAPPRPTPPCSPPETYRVSRI